MVVGFCVLCRLQRKSLLGHEPEAQLKPFREFLRSRSTNRLILQFGQFNVAVWTIDNQCGANRMTALRSYKSEDAPLLLALFRDTIRRINSRDYNPDQIRAWASDEIDPDVWAGRFIGRFVLVAEEAGSPIGFAELEANGHIDRFYVSADHQRQGVGRALLSAIVTEARRLHLSRLFTEASITARAFFESQGFQMLAPQVVTCRGCEFVNYRMERLLG
jgi:putative acetyltransferase